MNIFDSAKKDKLKVFICYARKDAAIADEIRLFLKDTGFAPVPDRAEILMDELIFDRTQDLLFNCDTVVFILSKQSITSKFCQEEMHQAERLDKPIIPIVFEEFDYRMAPPFISHRDPVFLYPSNTKQGSGFYSGQRELKRALNHNAPWFIQRRHLTERATVHERTGSDDAFLIGDELRGAKQWLERRPPDIRVSKRNSAFILASEEAEAIRDAKLRAVKEEFQPTLQEAERNDEVIESSTWGTLKQRIVSRFGFFLQPSLRIDAVNEVEISEQNDVKNKKDVPQLPEKVKSRENTQKSG